MNRALEHAAFPAIAERVKAGYRREDDAILLVMLGQEYVVRRTGVMLLGQRAPELAEGILIDYLLSRGIQFVVRPWRSLAELTGETIVDFRQRIELPLAQHASDLIGRGPTLLPHLDAEREDSLIGSDMAFTVRALPQVYLHVELSEESQDFPPEAWVLFSNNAGEFLGRNSLQQLAELFKDRCLSLMRIY